jgi:glycosyltransferase involved in cell wall biosynthesis
MSRRPTVSVALIVLNEEQNLRELLPRLHWADEIVVVDGGSRDRTLALAEELGARTFRRPFDHFAAQRNFALEQCRCQWVLSIDADERPSPALLQELRERLVGARYSGFRVPIRSRIFGRPLRFSGTQDDRPIRVFRRSGARWTGNVHERLEVRGRVGRFRGWLDHATLPTVSVFLAKMDRYTSLEARRRAVQTAPPGVVRQWLAPCFEIARRLIFKYGIFDGPQGWAFCLLSGLSEWVLISKHRQLWRQRKRAMKFRSGGAPRPHFVPRRRMDAGAGPPGPFTQNATARVGPASHSAGAGDDNAHQELIAR